jgi:hypothetical protein
MLDQVCGQSSFMHDLRVRQVQSGIVSKGLSE